MNKAISLALILVGIGMIFVAICTTDLSGLFTESARFLMTCGVLTSLAGFVGIARGRRAL